MPPAIAAVAAGVAAGFAASSVVVGIAVAIGTVALQSSLKPEMPGVEESVNESQTLTTQPLQPHRGVYGECVVSGSIIGYGKRKMGDKEAHVVVVTLAGHQIESAELYEVNGKPKPSGTTFSIMSGDQTLANPVALQYCDGWTESHIGFGRAYAVVTIPIDPEEMPSGLQNITFKVKGKRVYDPRKDTTAGGDGPHRANDESTWEWSDNAILCAFDYQRFHGFRQLSLNKFDLAHVMEQANICDEMVNYADSEGQQQSEKRFTCNGSWTFDQSPPKVLERIMSACGGKPYRRGGKIYLHTASYHGMAELTLTDTDASGEIIITPHRELKDRCNLVRASLQDPKKGYQPTDAPVVTNSLYIDRDGMELEDELQLNFTNSATMAQRLMKYHLERNRAGMRIQFPCKAKGLLAMAGKTVHVDLPNEGIDKEFIVTDWGFDADSKKVSLVLEEESPGLYSDSLVPSEGNVTPNTELPDFTRPDAPDSVSFTPDTISTHRQGYITWSHPAPRAVTEYRVLVRKDGDDIVEYPVIARSGVQLKQDINGLDAGQYSIEIYARNRYDRTSVPATISLTLNEPSPPTSLGATAGNWEIILAPTLAGIGLGTVFEFAYGTPDNIIGRGANVVIPGLKPDTEHNVYARTVNILGRSTMRHEVVKTTLDDEQVSPFIGGISEELDNVQTRIGDIETDIDQNLPSIDVFLEQVSQDITEIFQRRQDVQTEQERRTQQYQELGVEIQNTSSALNVRIDEVQADAQGNAKAISGVQLEVGQLGTNLSATINRVDQVEVDAEGNATALSLLQGQVNDPANNTSALYSFAQQAKTTADGNASSITALENTVNDVESGLTATIGRVDAVELTAQGNATALSLLQGQVNDPANNTSALYSFAQQAKTTADGNASSITALQNTVNDSSSGLSATNTLAQAAKTLADGNASALTQLDARVTENENFAAAQLQLNVTYDDSLSELSARAFLGTDVNGRVTGIDINDSGSTQQIEFLANSFVFLNGAGTPVVYWDAAKGRYVFNGEIFAQAGTFSGLMSGGSINIGNGSFQVSSSGHITQDGGYYRTADQYSPDARVLIDGRSNADYKIWVGVGSATDANGLFWIKPNGTGFISQEFFQGKIIETRYGSDSGALPITATAVGHNSAGNTVEVSGSMSAFSQASSNLGGNQREITLTFKRGSTVIGTRSVSAVGQYDSSFGVTLWSFSLSFTVIDNAASQGQTYNYSIEASIDNGSANGNIEFKTFENKLG